MVTHEEEATQQLCEDYNNYRYGFNGMEKDDEVSSRGNSYDYGFRIYNPRLGRFLSVDPLTKSFPWFTPYQFAGNTPIQALDLDGLEILDYRASYKATSFGSFLNNGDYISVLAVVTRQGSPLNYEMRLTKDEVDLQTIQEVMNYWDSTNPNMLAENLNNESVSNNEYKGAPAKSYGAKGEIVKGNKYDGASGTNRANGAATGAAAHKLGKTLYQASQAGSTLRQQNKVQELEAFSIASDATNLYSNIINKAQDYLNLSQDYEQQQFKADIINYIVDKSTPMSDNEQYGKLVVAIGEGILSKENLNLKKSSNTGFGGYVKEIYKKATGGE